MPDYLEIIAILVLLFIISLLSVPAIYLAFKAPLEFAGLYSKRAIIFSAVNAVLVAVILVIGSVILGVGVADESAGSAMIMMVKVSLFAGLAYGFLFSYLIMYLFNSFMAKS